MDDWEVDTCPECGGVMNITDDLCDDCYYADEWMYDEGRFDDWGDIEDD